MSHHTERDTMDEPACAICGDTGRRLDGDGPCSCVASSIRRLDLSRYLEEEEEASGPPTRRFGGGGLALPAHMLDDEE